MNNETYVGARETYMEEAVDMSEKENLIQDKVNYLTQICRYKVEEVKTNKPWGGYIRLSNDDAEEFVSEYFKGLSYNDACLGNPEVQLSPKILIVSPGQRLSWQVHERRAERWHFLNSGAYYKSATDDMGELQYADKDEEVQFAQGERHRLVSPGNSYVYVAEIWQHTDPDNPSDEDDIKRLQDDYAR